MERLMKKQAPQERITDYIESWGMVVESLGGTRMMGKILGWLIICDPPEQSAADIALAVQASAGTVSTTTRTLVQAAMIEKVGLPGKRSAYFRVKPGMWAQLMKARMARMHVMGQLADDGLELSPGPDGEPNDRLREIGSYVRFIEREFPALLDRWVEEWNKERRR